MYRLRKNSTLPSLARYYSTETSLPRPPSSAHPPVPPVPLSTPRPTNRTGSSTLTSPRPRRLPPPSHNTLPASFGRNQLLSVPDATKAKLNSIVSSFNAPIRYAFAYGSGVFPQSAKQPGDKPMLDFIFAVTHPAHWHSINLAQYPAHYPLTCRALGSSFISHVQRSYGAGVWYCTYVPLQGEVIKYGVISLDTLCNDLLAWDTLYVSGRMHKPIRIIRDDARVRLTQQVNLVSAVRASLLLLPEEFSEDQLWSSIAGLSYSGDPRMSLPTENPNKVHNIVSAQHAQFNELYVRLVRGLPGVSWREHAGQVRQDGSAKHRAALLRKLPETLRQRVRQRFSHLSSATQLDSGESDEGAFWLKVADADDLRMVLASELSAIIRRPALTQSLKGLVTAGPMKSVRYGYAKVRKWWLSAGRQVKG